MTLCNISSQTLLQFVQEWQLLWERCCCAGAPGKRSALPHSRVMIHQPSGGAQGVATDMEINLREMLKLKDELYKIISQHSGQTFDKVHKDSERDYWMIAEEAKEYGMIDEVLKRS
jgi:ATP-dependent Clp protease protease subunit